MTATHLLSFVLNYTGGVSFGRWGGGGKGTERKPRPSSFDRVKRPYGVAWNFIWSKCKMPARQCIFAHTTSGGTTPQKVAVPVAAPLTAVAVVAAVVAGGLTPARPPS